MSFSGMPAGQRLAIRYASMEASTITVQVNDKFVRKLNIHSSGALTGSYRTGVADLAIPANATLSIVLDAASRDSSD